MPKIPSPKDSSSDDPKGKSRQQWFKSHGHPDITLDLILLNIMSALENLTAAITRLQTSVDAAVTDINTPHPTDAQVQTAADAINAQSDRLEAAVNPPPPPPPAP